MFLNDSIYVGCIFIFIIIIHLGVIIVSELRDHRRNLKINVYNSTVYDIFFSVSLLHHTGIGNTLSPHSNKQTISFEKREKRSDLLIKK